MENKIVWYSTKDVLPEEFVSVLVYMPGEEPLPTVHEGYMGPNNLWWSNGFDRTADEITHWAIMPKFKTKKIINYEAITNMSISQLEIFLDEVYCAGLNTGLYAARAENIELSDALNKNPFSAKWLNDDAEPAVLPIKSDKDEQECLNALVKAVLRNAGITCNEEFKR